MTWTTESIFEFWPEIEAWSSGIPDAWCASRPPGLTWLNAEVGRLLLLFSSPAVVLLSGRAVSISGISDLIILWVRAVPLLLLLLLQRGVGIAWWSSSPGLEVPGTRSVTLPGLLPRPLSGREPKSRSSSETQLSRWRSNLCFTAGSIGDVLPVIISGASR